MPPRSPGRWRRGRSLIRQQRGNPLLCRSEPIESLPVIGLALVETTAQILNCPMRVVAFALTLLAEQFEFAVQDSRIAAPFRCLVMSILDSLGQCPNCPNCPQVDFSVRTL